MIAFYLSRAVAAGAALRCRRQPRAGHHVALLSATAFDLNMAATLAFVSAAPSRDDPLVARPFASATNLSKEVVP